MLPSNRLTELNYEVESLHDFLYSSFNEEEKKEYEEFCSEIKSVTIKKRRELKMLLAVYSGVFLSITKVAVEMIDKASN